MPKGHFERTDEHRRNISEALKGKPKSAEHIAKAAGNRLGSKHTAETRRKMSQAHKGRVYSKWTEEQRANLSAIRKGRSNLLFSRYGITEEEQLAQRAAGNRWCCVHKGFLPEDQFPGKQRYCKECGPANNRKALLKGDFGVDAAWYEARLAEQGGGCAICGSTKPRPDHKFLCIDHNHTTGANRGILCNRCNLFVGQLESPGLLEKAQVYLLKHSS